MLTQFPNESRLKKKGVGIHCPYPILRLLALPFIADKKQQPTPKVMPKACNSRTYQ